MQSIGQVLTKASERLEERLAAVLAQYTPSYFRERIPELNELDATDEMIQRATIQLMDRAKQIEECRGCTGFTNCRRPPGQEGMVMHMIVENGHISSLHSMCDQFHAYHQEQRWQRLLALSGKAANDKNFTFDNFPDAIFRRMRGMLSAKESLDSLIEAYCTTPVLVIDEFAQEAGTEFTIDVMFEVVNARFANSLPTFATSNYAPDQVYEKAMRKHRLEEKVEAIRSRLNQMMKHAFMDGEDGRKKDRETF